MAEETPPIHPINKTGVYTLRDGRLACISKAVGKALCFGLVIGRGAMSYDCQWRSDGSSIHAHQGPNWDAIGFLRERP